MRLTLCSCLQNRYSLFFTQRLKCLSLTIILVATSLAIHAQITGASVVCVGDTTTLSGSPTGGTWSSSSTLIATVGSSSGAVTGVAGGAVNITYTVGSSHLVKTFTVNPLPALYTVTGGGAYCAGTTGLHVGLSSSSSGVNYQLYNGTTAVSSPLSGIGGALDFGVQTAAGTYTVVGAITATGCSRTMTGSATITVDSASPVSGPTAYCPGAIATLSSSPSGGRWTSSNTAVATIGSASGTLTAVATGTSNITYTSLAGCTASVTVTVTTTTGTITASSPLCAGTTETVTESVPGGTWSSNHTAIASIGSLSGILTGVSGGVATITYSLGTLACSTTATVSVSGGPSSITGAAYVCIGSTSTLADATAGGAWSSSMTSIATISGTGDTAVIYGVAAGVTTISYTVAGCSRTLLVTVNPNPSSVSGPSLVCAGDSIFLTDAVGGGLWGTISANVSVDAATGAVTGITPGSATVDYYIGACFAYTTVTVVPVPSAIGLPMSDELCVGSAYTATDVPTGGTWGSSDASIASIGASSGIITGVSSGSVIISYTRGCTVVASLLVEPLSPIVGTPTVCVGQTTSLGDATLGGSWSSSNTAIGTVSGAGIVTGISAGTVTIDYTTASGCVASVTVTVYPLPSAIVGPLAVCQGMTINLSDHTSGGAWSSAHPAIGSVDPSLGIVTGISSGSTNITYTLGSTSCFVTQIVTVNTAAPAISGPANVCLGSAISLTDAGSGSWSSSDTAVDSITSSGVVYGLSLGAATITYTEGTSCYATAAITVVTPPPPVTGLDSICQGSSALYSDGAGAGVWTSSTGSIASVGSASGLVTGIAAGTATITFAASPGCIATHIITINTLPGGITGTTSICPLSTTTLTDTYGGGVWSSSDTTIAKIDSTTGLVTAIVPGTVVIYYTVPTGCFVSRTFNVISGPAPIIGYSDICIGTSAAFGDPTIGGLWGSSAPAIASVNSSGVVMGNSVGTAIITYSTGTACNVTFPVTVTPFPTAITGTPGECVGASTTLTETVAGGSWSSSNTTIATVGSGSGIVTGVSSGTVAALYTIGPSCAAIFDMTINPLPAPITGPNNVCQLQAVTLGDATPGGTWISSNPAIGSIDHFGDVTGLLPGSINIDYVNTFGCITSYAMTVNAQPSAINGSSYGCLGSTTALTDTLAGGVWSSFNTGVATIGSLSGIVTGISLGTATIVYTVPSSGCFSSLSLTVAPLPATFTITGGGHRCSDDSGVHIGLSGSQTGDNYLLYLGSHATGPFAGTGSALDFGLQTLAGTYTVISTSTATGCSAAMTGPVTVAIIPAVPVSVGLREHPHDTVCSGTTVSFTPLPVNGGSGASYQWSINSIPVSLATSYSYIPANGDIVKVTMISDTVCPAMDSVSDSMTVTVLAYEHPSVHINVSPGDTVCEGSAVTLTPSPTYGGASPSYTWLRNGAPTYSSGAYTFVPNDGDVVYCVIISDYPCLLSGVDTSVPVTISVDTPVLPSIFIGAAPGSTVSQGQYDTLTAYVSHAVAPTYQWYLNTASIPGATTNTYIGLYSSLVNDSVTCVVTTNGVCRITTFQYIFINVVTGVAQLSATGDITVLPNPNKGEFIVSGALNQAAGNEVNMEMTDMLGRQVYKKTAAVNNGKLNEKVELGTALANGVYILSVHTGTESKVFHIVVEQ